MNVSHICSVNQAKFKAFLNNVKDSIVSKIPSLYNLDKKHGTFLGKNKNNWVEVGVDEEGPIVNFKRPMPRCQFDTSYQYSAKFGDKECSFWYV